MFLLPLVFFYQTERTWLFLCLHFLHHRWFWFTCVSVNWSAEYKVAVDFKCVGLPNGEKHKTSQKWGLIRTKSQDQNTLKPRQHQYRAKHFQFLTHTTRTPNVDANTQTLKWALDVAFSVAFCVIQARIPGGYTSLRQELSDVRAPTRCGMEVTRRRYSDPRIIRICLFHINPSTKIFLDKNVDRNCFWTLDRMV